MATEQKATVTYTSNGTQTVYAFPFDYLQQSFVKVIVDGVDLTYGTDYVVVDKQVELTSAKAKGAVIVIYRETPTDRLVSWTDASVLSASDMTLFEVQLLHIAEETSDKVQESGLALDELDDNWDARYHILKNLLDPVSAGDAVTLRYFQSTQAGYIQASQAKVDAATHQANIATTKASEASASASAAKTSENNAKASEIAAKTSETNAKASENAAKTSETNAATSASNAANSASTATTKAGEASTSATNAANSATQAQNYANQASNSAGYTKAEADAKFSPSGFGYDGTTAKVLTSGYNIDNLINNGIYRVPAPVAPSISWSSSSWWWLEVIAHDSNWVVQRIIPFAHTDPAIDGKHYYRVKQNGTWGVWKTLGTEVAVLTGTVAHGGTVPLPSGFTQAQCAWIVSTKQDHQVRAWDVYEGGVGDDYIHYRTDCYTDANRVVTCGTYIQEIGGWSWTGIANYMIVGVK